MLQENGICTAVRRENILRAQVDDFEQETFLLLANGSIRFVLPGCPASVGPDILGMIQICRDAVAAGDAGAGCVAIGQGRMMGGWCSYRCRLLSARRFVMRCGTTLLQGQSVQDVLTGCVRQALGNVFARAERDAPSRQIWQEGRRITEETLLDCGWQLEGFIPRRLQIEKEKS